jgi:hypothetical protein
MYAQDQDGCVYCYPIVIFLKKANFSADPDRKAAVTRC